MQTVCVTIEDHQRTESGNRERSLLDDSEELVELAADIVQTATSMATSVASAVKSESGPVTKRDSVRIWKTASLDGVPPSRPRRERIVNWSKEVDFHRDSFVPSLKYFCALSDVYTPVTSEVEFSQRGEDDDDFELDADLAKQRYLMAQQLFEKKDFANAICHLRNTLTTIPEKPSLWQDVRFLLANTLLEINPVSDEAERILRELSEDESAPSHHQVLHDLARAQFALYHDDLPKAKGTCLQAIKKRSRAFGRIHDLTVESITLMIQICHAAEDIDAGVWREILENMGYEYSQKAPETTTSHGIWAVSERPRILDVGEKLIYELDGISTSPQHNFVLINASHSVFVLDARNGCKLIVKASGRASHWPNAFAPDDSMILVSKRGFPASSSRCYLVDLPTGEDTKPLPIGFTDGVFASNDLVILQNAAVLVGYSISGRAPLFSFSSSSLELFDITSQNIIRWVSNKENKYVLSYVPIWEFSKWKGRPDFKKVSITDIPSYHFQWLTPTGHIIVGGEQQRENTGVRKTCIVHYWKISEDTMSISSEADINIRDYRTGLDSRSWCYSADGKWLVLYGGNMARCFNSALGVGAVVNQNR